MSLGVSLNWGRFATIAMVAAGIGQAAVPPDVAAKLREMGRGVCVPGTALLYKPMQLKPPAGVKIERVHGSISEVADKKGVIKGAETFEWCPSHSPR